MTKELLEELVDPNSTSAKSRAKAAELQAEADERATADETALSTIISRLQARSGLVRECMELERFANTDETTVAREALGELTSWLLQGAVGGKQRFDLAAVAYAGRVMMRPHIGAAIEERRQRITEIDSEVVATARSHGLGLPKIRAHVSRAIGRPLSELVPES